MMKNADKYLTQPLPDQKIWRYMSFEKFIYLLHYRSVFFPQAKQFEDPYEGFYSGFLRFPPDAEINDALRRVYHAPNGPRAYCVISCWHMNEHESSAMWRLYSLEDHGIAIQSSVARLAESLDFSDFRETLTGAVKYSESPLPASGRDGVMPQTFVFFHKPESFAHENEYRILGIMRDVQTVNNTGGVNVPVNLETLLEAIYVSPKSESWVTKLVQDMVKETYSLNAPVINSTLFDPLFPDTNTESL